MVAPLLSFALIASLTSTQVQSSAALLLEQASAAAQAGDFRRALPILEEALAASEGQPDRSLLARSLVGLGWAQWGTGQYDRALASHERALAIFRELGDAGGETLALLRLGETMFSKGRYADALARYDEALRANSRAPDPVREGSILSNQGSALRFLGRYDEAVRVLDRASEIFRDANDEPGTAMVLTFLGIVNRARGEYAQAIDAYTRAIALRAKLGDKRGEAQAVGNLGNVYRDLGQFEKAVEAFRRSLKLAQEAGYTAQIGFASSSLGGVFDELGRSAEALERYEAALAIWRKIDRKAQIGWTLRDIGLQQLHVQRSPDRARRAFEEAMSVARAVGDPEMEGYLHADLGDVARESGSPAAALDSLNEALALAKRIGSPRLESEVLAGRGRLRLSQADDLEAAIQDLRASAAIVNDLRARVTSDQSKVSFLDKRQRVFQDLASALVKAGRPAEALEAAEASRARAFADLLESRQVKLHSSDQPLLLELRSAVTASSGSTGAGDGGRGSDVETVLGRLRSQNAELASLVAVESPGIEEVRATARRLNATIVEYLSTDQALLLWVVKPSGDIETRRSDVTSDRLVSLVRGALDWLNEPVPVSDASPPPVRQLRQLYDIALAPVEGLLPEPGALLVVIPHGPLALIPFSAMTGPDGAPLVARYRLATAPSISVFRYTAGKRHAARDRATALIVAAPEPPAGAELPSLPGGLDEGRRVAARLQGLAPELLVGPAASERAVKQRIRSAGLVHFATHGLVSEARPSDSSLVLRDGEGEDGYLKVSEVFGLELEASLVVLSGCSTGRGRLTGDGIFGLSRAFMYAGTPAVVVSLWDVSDRATAFLMDRFYAELARSDDRAAALRTAQLAARERYPHPSLWAPFMLVGEPR